VEHHLAMTAFTAAATAANNLNKKIVNEMANVKIVEASHVFAHREIVVAVIILIHLRTCTRRRYKHYRSRINRF
jgi:hypothetical protein